MFQKINKQHVWGHGKIKICVDYLVLTGIVIRRSIVSFLEFRYFSQIPEILRIFSVNVLHCLN